MTKSGEDHSFLGGRLNSYRKRKNLTLKALAQLTGISQPTLSEVENGHYDLSGEKLAALIRNTDINVRWLLIGEGEMFSKQLREGEERGASICCIAEESELPQETNKAVSMAVEILTSDTKYARLLAENIKSLHESIQFTHRIESLEGDLADTRLQMVNVTERMAALEIAERERLRKRKREGEETPPPASSAEDDQKTAS